MLAGLNEILQYAEKSGFAVPAFNVYNMETVMGVLHAAEEAGSPVILQSYSRLFTNEEGYFVSPIILAAAQKASVPICFHLDHGAGETEVLRALRYGATGIMIDKSSLPFEENMRETKKIVGMCHAVGVAVEGELGHIGSVNDAEMQEFTRVDEAEQYMEETGVCALAVLVGTAHGIKKRRNWISKELPIFIKSEKHIWYCTAEAASPMIRSARPYKPVSARSISAPTFVIRFWIRCLKPRAIKSPSICL